jgi:5-methylcytosine-specific restriction endonuclease McrA
MAGKNLIKNRDRHRSLEDDIADALLANMEEIQHYGSIRKKLKRNKKKREAGSLSYQAWRYAVFTRDKFTCQQCGKKLPMEELEAHHLKPFSVAPELEHVVSNGLALCHECHVKTDSYGGRGKEKTAIKRR